MVGITGGGVLVEIGDKIYFEFFFYCIDKFFLSRFSDESKAQLVRRLYCKYVKYEDLDETMNLLRKIQDQFEAVTEKEVLNEVNQSRYSKLSADAINLNIFFSRIFEGIYQCLEASSENMKAFANTQNYSYEPVMIVRADLPYYFDDKNRPFEAIEAHDGAPLWFSDIA